MKERIRIDDWSPQWADNFRAKSAVLRRSLGPMAVRIDHIGSTSIRGLAAKPIVDIQISVVDFEPMDRLEAGMNMAGCEWRPTNREQTKRYFREQPGSERTHIHIRRAGSWHEQWALLFRDFMRAHPGEHGAYATLKRDLADRCVGDRAAYTEGKADFLWAVIRRADLWASDIGWHPGASDA
jgi:GrpB-like predicted nucleotidyltransferase (UPF0157 family)